MHRLSLISFWCCSLLILATAFLYYPRWKQAKTEATISWDASGYYMYLPAALIYGDMKGMGFFPAIEAKYNPGPGMGQAFKHEASGNYVMKYSMGQALQMLPWFAVAHVTAPLLGYEPDGFSRPYQVAISWGSLLVAMLGLWFARNNLLRYFSDQATAIALFLLTFGSNYLNYTAIDGAMTHNWLFTLYTLIIYTTIRFYERPTWGKAVAIGALCGWATLTRPTEIVTILIPLLWNWDRQRLAFFRQHFALLAVAAVSFVAVAGMQAVYWKWATGAWLVYSYQDQGFDWLHPHVKEVIFGFRAGWLPYSPVMAFALPGIWHFWKNNKQLALPVAFTLAIITYITCAWSIWWYGGTLGARAMVQGCALWLFPMAAFAQWITTKKWAAWVFPLVFGFCIWHNLWWTHQAHRGGLFVVEQMTQAYFLKVYGKDQKERDWDKLLDSRDEFRVDNPKNVRTIWTHDYEKDSLANIHLDKNGKSIYLNTEHIFTPKYAIPLSQTGQQEWLRLHFDAKTTDKEWESWKMTQLIVRIMEGDKIVRERMIRPQRLLESGESRRLYMDIKVPKSGQRVEFYCWNAGTDKTLFVDNWVVEQFNE
jgi:hypothetical protein